MLKRIRAFRKKVSEKGLLFKLIFYFFFTMFIIPTTAFFIIALIKGNIPWLVIMLTLIGIFAYDVRYKRLYQSCLLIVISNMLLWFIMGLMPFVQGFLSELPGILTYLLLIPYAFISGGMTYILLWKATHDEQKTLRGFVLISMMIALVAVTTDVVRTIAENFSNGISHFEWVAPWLFTILEGFLKASTYNPVIGFFIVLVTFNWGVIYRFVKSPYRSREVALYIIPVITFFLFIWAANAF